MRKVIITVAPTGNVPNKKLNPNTPVTPDEIAEDVYRCYKAGASVAHIHARDNEGKPTADTKVFKEIMDKVREKCDIVVQLSTGARAGQGEARGNCIDLKPEMASLATGSSNFATAVNDNPPELIEYMGKKMIENGVVPEIEAFDVSMISNIGYYLKKGAIETLFHFNLVMNVPGSISGTPKNLMHMVESLPKDSIFTVSGIGKSHVDMITMGIILGGNVRVGLEDVLVYSYEDNTPATNEMLVKRAAQIIRDLGYEVATPAEAREILGL